MAQRKAIRGRKSGKAKAKQRPKPRSRSVTQKDLEPVYPWERQPDESPQAFAAFAAYLDGDGSLLMPERSARETARKLKKHWSQVSEWSAKYDWVRRAEAKDRHDMRLRARAQEREIALMNDRQAQNAMIGAAAAMAHIRKFIKTADNPEPARMRDRDAIRLFDIAAKIERVARGEADSISQTKNEVSVSTVDDKRASMVKLLEDPEALKHMAAISRLLGTDGGRGS